jgi:fumarate hydratase subunit beta
VLIFSLWLKKSGEKMAKIVKLKTPLKDEDINNLQIGDTVLLSGTIYTGRDAAHKRLIDLINQDKELPIKINGQVMYYVGPAPAPPGKPIGSAGPTTSYRMDPLTPALLDRGLKATIGKGPRGKEVIESMKKNKAIYLAAAGGVAALIAKSIKKAEVIAYEDLGAEAIRKLEVVDFPCIVANDVNGNDLFVHGSNKYRE